MVEGKVNYGRKWEESGRVCVVVQDCVVLERRDLVIRQRDLLTQSIIELASTSTVELPGQGLIIDRYLAVLGA